MNWNNWTDTSIQMLDQLWDLKHNFQTGKYWGWEYEISIRMAQLWFTMISNLSLSATETPNELKQQERIQCMISYIHQNYANSISLQQIADSAHLSVSECNRSFKKTLHTTPYDYLLTYRLKKSTELLTDTDFTITEIARRVGFNHVNHFIQSFKKHHQITPKEYRKSKG